MSFLVDPPLLYGAGRAYARLGPERARRPDAEARFAGATLAVFLVTSVSLYLERRWTRPLWRACGARSGRDWMINSGVFSVDIERVRTRGHVLAALAFATYPLWLYLGLRRRDG